MKNRKYTHIAAIIIFSTGIVLAILEHNILAIIGYSCAVVSQMNCLVYSNWVDDLLEVVDKRINDWKI